MKSKLLDTYQAQRVRVLARYLFIVIWFLQYCFAQKLPKNTGSTNFTNNSRYQCSYNTYSVALLVISPDIWCQSSLNT